jgi:hypothetical protein
MRSLRHRRRLAALAGAGLVASAAIGALLLSGGAAAGPFAKGSTVAPVGTVAVADTPVAATAQALGALSPATAVQEGIRAAQRGFSIGRLVGEPTEIRGRLLPLSEARQLLGDPPLEPVDAQWPQRDAPVWLVVLRGNVEARNPGKNTFTQVSMVLDATTGAVQEVTLHHTGKPLPVAMLPVLTRPSAPAPIPPTPTRPPVAPTHPAKPAAPPDRVAPTGTPDPN